MHVLALGGRGIGTDSAILGVGIANDFDDNKPLEGRGCGVLITAFPAPLQE